MSTPEAVYTGHDKETVENPLKFVSARHKGRRGRMDGASDL